MGGVTIPLLSLALGVVPVPQDSAPEQDPQRSVFVEWTAPGRSWFSGQVIPLRLRVGVEETFLREHLIQPFRSELNLPLRLSVPGLDEIPGLARLAAPRDAEVGDSTRSLVLEDRVVRGSAAPDRQVNGRTFRVAELDLPLAWDRSGQLLLPPVQVEFSFATRFRQDFLDGRRAVDPQDASITGLELELAVESLPDVGRPDGFFGLVGAYRADVELTKTELEVGDTAECTLRIRGEGNLPRIAETRLADDPALADFHIYGSIEQEIEGGRAVRIDLTPRNPSVTELPSLAVVYFDPVPPGRYRIVRTEAIPLTVRPSSRGIVFEDVRTTGPDAEAAEDPAGPTTEVPTPRSSALLLRDLLPVTPPGAPPRPLGSGWFWLALIGPWFLAAGFLGLRRQRRLRQRTPEQRRAAEAAAVFQAGIHDTQQDAGRLLSRYLASRLECREAAVIAPQLSDRLVVRGIERVLAERTARRLERLVAARFGATVPQPERSELATLVDELEHGFRRRAR